MKMLTLLVLASSFFSAESYARITRWTNPIEIGPRESQRITLGNTFLANGREGDFVQVDNRHSCGLTHFQLQVRGDGAVINDLKVMFGNGDVQDITVRERFNAGTFSRWVDLQGDTRCIRGIYVYGHSFLGNPRQSNVVFFGLKNSFESRTKLLGATALANRGDLDVIQLRQPVCGLTKFKITVRNDAAQIEYLQVQFGNGRTQQINVRERFAAGSSSVWKDLAGGERCISRVLVAGRSNNNTSRQAIVEFWGLDPR